METGILADSAAAKVQFEDFTAATPSFEEIVELARGLKADRSASLPERRRALAAALVTGAFAAPERTADIFDAAAMGWLGKPVNAPRLVSPALDSLPLSENFWTAFWDLAQTSRQLDPGALTIGVAALGLHIAPEFQQRAAASCVAYPGVDRVGELGIPARAQLDVLKACPGGSLGEQLYRLIVDNGFDLEVLDRDALALDTLMPPLNYLNTRILYAHDLWHVVAGYHLTALHEVALSSFQLAQFGHGYSAMFLAVVVASAALQENDGFDLLMETILHGWRHGRETPPMILVPWDKVWHQTADAVREQYGVTPFVSPFPSDIFEQLAQMTMQAA